MYGAQNGRADDTYFIPASVEWKYSSLLLHRPTTRRLIAVVVLSCSNLVCSTYVVVAPQIVRAGSSYDVVVTILAATSSVNVDVSLRNQRNVSVASNTVTATAGQNSFSRMLGVFAPQLVAWSSGRALVFGRCAFTVLLSSCS